jgi:hypothetical protein
MRRYTCPRCGNEVHFGNTLCVRCDASLGYVPDEDLMAFADVGDGVGGDAPACANRDLIGCNWLCDDPDDELCLSCRHTTTIPDISGGENRDRWGRLERAKRRLLYAILRFNLPVKRNRDAPRGFLHFEFLGDEVAADGTATPAITGHSRGCITINIREADDSFRERMRAEMGEAQRTLLGHLRHEVGHYYWDKLVDGSRFLDEFRAIFGDERRDYAEALAAYYENGPAPDWPHNHVSAYSNAHPWEDFAETWAHYLHMVEGLETAYAYGLKPQPLHPGAAPLADLPDPYHARDINEFFHHWIPLTVAMNAMNRAIGVPDFYPFVLTEVTRRKLRFVHDLIEAGAASAIESPAAPAAAAAAGS